MPRGRREHANFRNGLLVGLTPLLLAYALFSFYRLSLKPDLGYTPHIESASEIRPGGPAEKAGLLQGDRLITVNGVSPNDRVLIIREFNAIRPGSHVIHRIERDDTEHTIVIVAGETPQRDRIRTLIRAVVGISFILLGLVVYWNRSDRVARLFYACGLSFGFLLIDPPSALPVAAQFLVKVAFDFAILFVAPAFLQLFLYFPRHKTISSRLFFLRPFIVPGTKRWVRFPPYLLSGIVFAASLGMNISIYFTGITRIGVVMLFQAVSALYLLACILGGIGAFLHSYATTRSPEMRRKLHGVVWGTTIALFPIAATNVIKQVRPDTEIMAAPYFFLLTILLPLSFGHAIIRYGLLDLELIVKRSILYTLLTALLAASYVVLVDIVGRVLRDVTGQTTITPTLLTLFLIALFFSPARNLIQEWVDRTFYREKFRYRKTLHEFSNAITSILDLDTLLHVLVSRISSTLHVPDVAVFLREEQSGNHIMSAHSGLAEVCADGEFSFSVDDRIIKHLRRFHEALPVDRVADGEGTMLLPHAERKRLGDLGATLLIPLISSEELTGMVSLGSKQSGEFFSAEDRELLNTLANQASLAIENAKLHRDTIEKERMKNELAVAREIQLAFLPPAPPSIRGVDVAALNVPSEEVGGDYYDYVIGGEKELGIVIGDAVGHGVTAALLMASLQACFRAEALIHRSPSDVLRRINRQVNARSGMSSFLTVFYGMLDTESGKLRYANAGHNAPLLIRADGTCDAVGGSDLILGVEKDVAYREHSVQMNHGDTLVLFTDGVTDEPNEAGDSFGTDRLIRLIKESGDLSASRVASAVYRDVISFYDESPPDDITLLILRYTG